MAEGIRVGGGGITLNGEYSTHIAGEDLAIGDFITLTSLGNQIKNITEIGNGAVSGYSCVGTLGDTYIMVGASDTSTSVHSLYFYVPGYSVLSIEAAGFPVGVIEMGDNNVCVLIGRDIYIDAYFVRLDGELTLVKTQLEAMTNTVNSEYKNLYYAMKTPTVIMPVGENKYVFEKSFDKSTTSRMNLTCVFTLTDNTIVSGNMIKLAHSLYTYSARIPNTQDILSIIITSTETQVFVTSVDGMSLSQSQLTTTSALKGTAKASALLWTEDTKYFFVYGNDSTGLYGVIINFDGTNITVGDTVQLNTAKCNYIRAISFRNTVLIIPGYYSGSTQVGGSCYVVDASSIPTLIKRLGGGYKPTASYYSANIAQPCPGNAIMVTTEPGNSYPAEHNIVYISTLKKAVNAGLALRSVTKGSDVKVNISL